MMKHRWTLLFLGAAFFVLLTGMSMPAPQTDPSDLQVEITPLENLRVQLTAQNGTGKKLYLTVLRLEKNTFRYDTETEVYTEQIAGNVAEINRTLNLSKLESGTYQVRIKAGKKRFARLFDIRSKPAEVADDARIISIK